MSWFYRNNEIRAAELNTMAHMTWQRQSQDPQNRLEVRLVNPNNPHGAFIVLCDGLPASGPIKRTTEVQKFIRKFFLRHEKHNQKRINQWHSRKHNATGSKATTATTANAQPSSSETSKNTGAKDPGRSSGLASFLMKSLKKKTAGI